MKNDDLNYHKAYVYRCLTPIILTDTKKETKRNRGSNKKCYDCLCSHCFCNWTVSIFVYCGDMIYVLTVYATFGVILTVPTVYSSYEQCMYHAENIEKQRRWTMDSPTITAKCDEKQ